MVLQERREILRKQASLKHITPINYNEGSNNDNEEEDIEEEGGVAYQYNTDISTVTSYARKSSNKAFISRVSPSSLQNKPSKRPIKPDGAAKAQRKRKNLDLNESGSDNSTLEVKKLQKKDPETELIKEQLKVTQE